MGLTTPTTSTNGRKAQGKLPESPLISTHSSPMQEPPRGPHPSPLVQLSQLRLTTTHKPWKSNVAAAMKKPASPTT